MSDVIDFKEEKKKRAKGERQPPKKIKQEVLYEALAAAINHDPLSTLPEFPEKYFVVVPNKETGARLIYKEEGPGMVRPVSASFLEIDLIQYCRSLGEEAYLMDTRKIALAVAYWLAITTPIPVPKIFGFKESEGYCTQRLPWSKYPEQKGTPTFDELFSRISNGDSLKKWIGSLFFSEADTQQYVYLVGKGGDGKSSLSRFLERVFGRSAKAQAVPDRTTERFWTSDLIGKRLVILGDVPNNSFTQSAIFKSITGGDSVRIEEKYKASFDIRLPVKFLFTSNHDPDIGTNEADQRRIIYCSFTEKGSYRRSFEDDLWAEGNEFISECIHAYLSSNSDHSPITVDQSEAMAVGATVEDEFEVVAETNFTLDSQHKCTPSQFQQIVAKCFHSRKERLAFTAYLKRKFGVKKAQKRESYGITWYYYGLKPKNWTDNGEAIAKCGFS